MKLIMSKFIMVRKKVKQVLLSALVISVILCVYVSAITGSIGNARAILYPKVGFLGETIERTILVSNKNNVSINVTLEASQNISNIIKLIDKEFTLAPGEEIDARFDIVLKKEGDYEGNIIVYFKNAEEKGAGVALSSTLIIRATKKGFWESDEEEVPIDDSIDEEAPINKSNEDIEDVNNKPISLSLIVISSTTILLIIALVLLMRLYKKSKQKKKRSGRNL